MEKLFFSITRWLMLVGATIAFVFLIGGGIYAFNLYKTSQDTQVNGNTYQTKEPKVSFDSYKKIQDKELELKRKQRKRIEQYVLKVVANGSKGHGFPMGNMPPNMLKDKSAKIVAKYVSNQLSGEKPTVFGACASCHGDDGGGDNGASPSLLTLPIYNGLVSKTADKTAYAPSESYVDTTKYANPLEQYSAKIASYINKYAILVEQEGVTVDQIFEFMKGLSKKYDDDSFLMLQQQLENGLKSLFHYGEDFKESKKDAIAWRDFIDWFLKDFNMQIQKENQKYQNSLNELQQAKNQKQNKALEAQVELLQLLTALGTALIAFILLTMILVLFKIEANTRKNNEMIEE